MYLSKQEAQQRADQISNPQTKWVPFKITRAMTRENGGRYNQSDVGKWDLRRDE